MVPRTSCKKLQPSKQPICLFDLMPRRPRSSHACAALKLLKMTRCHALHLSRAVEHCNSTHVCPRYMAACLNYLGVRFTTFTAAKLVCTCTTTPTSMSYPPAYGISAFIRVEVCSRCAQDIMQEIAASPSGNQCVTSSLWFGVNRHMTSSVNL